MCAESFSQLSFLSASAISVLNSGNEMSTLFYSCCSFRPARRLCSAGLWVGFAGCTVTHSMDVQAVQPECQHLHALGPFFGSPDSESSAEFSRGNEAEAWPLAELLWVGGEAQCWARKVCPSSSHAGGCV